MEQEKLRDWVLETKNNEILLSFLNPVTQAQVIKKHSVSRYYLKQFLKTRLIECLSQNPHKGQVYVLTNKAKRLLQIHSPKIQNKISIELLGWILASPKQRLVVLQTLSKNPIRLTSEQIRMKSKNNNPCLSRISTKNILRELTDKGLVETEMGSNRRRYYWISDLGISIVSELH